MLVGNTEVVYLQQSRTEKYKTLMFQTVNIEVGRGSSSVRLLVNDVRGVCMHVILSSHVGKEDNEFASRTPHAKM